MKIKLILTILLVTSFFTLISLNSTGVEANGTCIPAACKTTYVPDFACINNKILDPTTTCCENKCPCDPSTGKSCPGSTDIVLAKYKQFGILGVTIKIDETSIPSLVNVFLTTFLGIIALYALFRGIYVAGIKRTQATEENLTQVNRELTNIVIAFIVAFGFIFIIQIVFNLFGLGSLTSFNVNFDGKDAGGPELVINSNTSSSGN